MSETRNLNGCLLFYGNWYGVEFLCKTLFASFLDRKHFYDLCQRLNEFVSFLNSVSACFHNNNEACNVLIPIEMTQFEAQGNLQRMGKGKTSILLPLEKTARTRE